MALRFLAGVLVAALALHARGETSEGAVIRVPEGDSLTILDITKTPYRVRIDGTDAGQRTTVGD